MSEENKNKNIELRSEKVRNIVGKVPPRLLRIGISIISVILLLVLILAYIIPYPEYKQVPICFYTNPSVQVTKAPAFSIFFSDATEKTVKKEQQICSLKLEDDSIINYYSDISGIFFCNYQNGDYIRQGDIILSIIPDSIISIYGICLIPVDEIRNIKEGQQLIISTQKQSFAGSIAKIYPIPELDRLTGKMSYRIEICLTSNIEDSNKEFLLPNIGNVCNILISNKPILRKILNY